MRLLHLASSVVSIGIFVAAASSHVRAQAPPPPLDLNADALGRNRVAVGGASIQPAQVALSPNGAKVALTFQFRIANPDPDGAGAMMAPAINWGFPVRETADMQWVKDNKTFITANPMTANPFNVAAPVGFSGLTEGLNHAHDSILDAADMSKSGYYGPHPHVQLYVFWQPGGEAKANMIGCSDLKHTFSTIDDEMPGGGDTPHFLVNGEDDTYVNHSNADRNFFGPIADIDKTTFVVPDHDHLGERAMVPDPADPTKTIPLTENGFNVWNRDHGEKDETNALEHLLQANTKLLRKAADGGVAPDATRWFFAASFFVVDELAAQRVNNTVFRQFNPGWDGAKFVPIWADADSKRLKDDMKTFLAVTDPGFFQKPFDHTMCAVPEPMGLAALASAWGCLVHWRRRP